MDRESSIETRVPSSAEGPQGNNMGTPYLCQALLRDGVCSRVASIAPDHKDHVESPEVDPTDNLLDVGTAAGGALRYQWKRDERLGPVYQSP